MKYTNMIDVVNRVLNQHDAEEVKGVETLGKTRVRKCSSIGLFVLDRSCATCQYSTPFCRQHCYCLKQYTQYPDMPDSDRKNEAYWANVTAEKWAEMLNRKRSKVVRFRFATRGEALSTINDIYKVRDLAKATPDIEYWIPTRSWHSPLMRFLAKTELMILPNVHVLASVDPSDYLTAWGTDLDMLQSVAAEGFSFMFFGNDHEAIGRMIARYCGLEYVQCAKTWKHEVGACATCDRGCFQTKTNNVFVHLLEH